MREKKILNMKKTKRIINQRNEQGYLIIEATFVYPIMFFIIFFLIYLGNMYFQKALINSVIAEEAIVYAAKYADPMLNDVNKDTPSVPKKASSKNTKELYRYLKIWNNAEASADEKKALKDKLEVTGFFGGMTPSDIKILKHCVDNKVIYQTYVVEVEYKLKFPIKFIFQKDATIVDMSEREEAIVCDTPEFIRNTDMIIDVLEKSDTFVNGVNHYEKILEKVDDFINKSGGESE